MCDKISEENYQIFNSEIRIQPSQKLIDFITSLEDDVEKVPRNIYKLLQKSNKDVKKIILESPVVLNKHINGKHLKFLSELNANPDHLSNFSNISETVSRKDSGFDIEKDNSKVEDITKQKDEVQNSNEDERVENKDEILLELNDIKWIKIIADELREKNVKIEYLHELMENSKLILPKNKVIPRSSELEARCRKLRAELDAKEYRNMTKNVDTTRKDAPEDSIGYQLKAINRQLIAVLQFIFSVAAGFAFGFIGVELMIGNLDFGFRLLLGVICALTIALAEIYFLAKKLNEYDDLASS